MPNLWHWVFLLDYYNLLNVVSSFFYILYKNNYTETNYHALYRYFAWQAKIVCVWVGGCRVLLCVCDCVLWYVIVCYCVRLCIAVWDCVLLCKIVYYCVWLCMHVCMWVWACCMHSWWGLVLTETSYTVGDFVQHSEHFFLYLGMWFIDCSCMCVSMHKYGRGMPT